jgi:hypothetical protein
MYGQQRGEDDGDGRASADDCAGRVLAFENGREDEKESAKRAVRKLEDAEDRLKGSQREKRRHEPAKASCGPLRRGGRRSRMLT